MDGIVRSRIPFFGEAGREERMVTVNGECHDIAGKTIMKYLETTGYDPQRIAVERNGDIVPKRAYSETVLNEGDRIEIVSFVGGG